MTLKRFIDILYFLLLYKQNIVAEYFTSLRQLLGHVTRRKRNCLVNEESDISTQSTCCLSFLVDIINYNRKDVIDKQNY